MKISEMIKAALEKKGYKNLKDASKMLDISPELLRVTINKGHIPKDNTLKIIAKKLDIDMSLLVLAAHQEKVPDPGVKEYFLTPSDVKLNRGKRKSPLSEEQTAYLAKVLSVDDIIAQEVPAGDRRRPVADLGIHRLYVCGGEKGLRLAGGNIPTAR